MKVCIMGLGYIGLPTAAILASNKVEVNGVDINTSVVETINKGAVHIIEPGLENLVKKGVSSGYLQASIKPVKSDVYMIVVPTPFKENNEPDISYVEAATRAVIPLLKEGDTFIIESTSPVGTTDKMAAIISKERPDLSSGNGLKTVQRLSFYIAYCPERVLPGNVFEELVNNDRVIGGINKSSAKKACEFYSLFVKGTLHETNAKTAEMCKLTENSSRDVQIAFANELSLICDKAGINVWELINLANKHPRVKILNPGCGVGGHCIAVDPWFLVADFPMEAKLIGAARQINNYKSFWCVEKIHNAILTFQLKNGKKPKVALMGLAFKPNIDDLRESPAKYIVSKVIQDDQDSEFFIVEPNVAHHILHLTNYQEAHEKADIVVFLVAHKQFKSLNNQSKVVIDFCGVTKNAIQNSLLDI